MSRIDEIRALCAPNWPKNINNTEMIEYHHNCKWLLCEVDRLTKGIKDIGKECARRHDEISRLTSETEKAWKQLHEEIALEQEQVKRIEQLEAELAGYREAEKDGRLIFRPCRMGETIYMITRHNKRMPSRVKITELMESNYFKVLREFGKTVFLTYREAEAALQRDNAELEDES